MSDQSGVRPNPADQLFGRIALKNNLITEEQLRGALAELGPGEDLAGHLVARGQISEKHATAIRRKVEERLGEGGSGSGWMDRGAGRPKT